MTGAQVRAERVRQTRCNRYIGTGKRIKEKRDPIPQLLGQ